MKTTKTQRAQRLLICAVSLCLLAGLVLAQGRHRKKPTMDLPPVLEGNIPKVDENLSGRFTFTRIRFDTSSKCQQNVDGPPWSGP